jgi:hypothetical protein
MKRIALIAILAVVIPLALIFYCARNDSPRSSINPPAESYRTDKGAPCTKQDFDRQPYADTHRIWLHEPPCRAYGQPALSKEALGAGRVSDKWFKREDNSEHKDNSEERAQKACEAIRSKRMADQTPDSLATLRMCNTAGY